MILPIRFRSLVIFMAAWAAAGPPMLFSQASSAIPVADVRLEGLKRTDEGYLRRFVQCQPGDPFNPVVVEQDLRRLRNISAVASVQAQTDTIPEGIAVIYQISEALTVFPLVNFGGIKDNFWFQLGALQTNGWGKGIQWSAFYLNNDRRSNFNLYTRIPYLGKGPWGISFNLYKWASIEPLYFEEGPVRYDYDNYGAGLSGIYEFRFNHFVEFGGLYFIDDFQKSRDQDFQPTPGPDQVRLDKTLFKFIHRFNRLNFYFFYLSGFDNASNWETVYTFDSKEWFHLFFNDTRYFKRIGGAGNVGFRLRLGLSSNNASPFAPFVLDSQVNIRGSGNRVDRGTGMMVLNAEYRYTVFDRPLFASQIVGFSDLGTWRQPGGRLDDFADRDNFRHFLGAGIRLIYKKAHNAILRVDYGVDIYNTRERGVVVGLGQYF